MRGVRSWSSDWGHACLMKDCKEPVAPARTPVEAKRLLAASLQPTGARACATDHDDPRDTYEFRSECLTASRPSIPLRVDARAKKWQLQTSVSSRWGYSLDNRRPAKCGVFQTI